MSLSFLDQSYTNFSDDDSFHQDNAQTLTLYKEPGFLLPPTFNVRFARRNINNIELWFQRSK
jgi:hypothetical protein